MKKQLLALAGVALLFAACSKNDDNNNTQPEPNPSSGVSSGLLKGMYSITDTVRIEYNSDKTVSKITSGWVDGTAVGGSIATIKYANGRAVEIWESAYDEKVWGPSELTTQFVYVGDKIQKVIEPGKADNYFYYDSARYNASGKIEKIFRYGGMKPNITKNGTDSLVWTGNNITKIVHEGFSMVDGVEKLTYTYTDVYTFDNKPSWQAPLGAAWMSYSFDPESFNANNILTQTRSQKDMADRVNKFEYKYNDKGNVTERTATYQFDRGPGTETIVFDYYK